MKKRLVLKAIELAARLCGLKFTEEDRVELDALLTKENIETLCEVCQTCENDIYNEK